MQPSTTNVPVQYAQGSLGTSVFGAFLNGALYDTAYSTGTAYSMVGFQPSKLAFLPLTPSTSVNAN